MNNLSFPGYSLSKTFGYDKERVYIYTDGEHQIFAYGVMDHELGLVFITVSEPAKIGNAP